jgi:hypothetical protein
MGVWNWFRQVATASAAAPPPVQQGAAPQPTTPPVAPVTPVPPPAPGPAPAAAKNPWEEIERALVWTIPAILLITLALTFAVVTQLVHGVERADEKTLMVGASALFACVALVFLTRLIRSLEDGQQLGVESHWGGLGGGVGGWRISMPVAYFIGVAAFAALAAVAVSNYSNTRPDKPSTNGPAPVTGTTSTSGTTSTTGTTASLPPPATTSSAATATQTTAATTTKKAR